MKLLYALLFIISFPAIAQTRISPGTQINWPQASGCTVAGTAYFPDTNTCVNPSLAGVVDVTTQTGTDIGQKVNAALTTGACASQSCILYIPPGNYTFTHQIILPQNQLGQYTLWGTAGTVLNWEGTTDAIITKPSFIGGINLTIEGFQLDNNGTGSFAGIHVYPSQRVTIRDMIIQNFTDGIRFEGVNSSNIQNNFIIGNANGVTLLSTFCIGTAPNQTCSPTDVSGVNYAANAINIDHNEITGSTQHAINIADSPGNGDSGALNDNISWNDLEENTAAIYSGKSTGLQIMHNYFEGSPHEIVLGLQDGGAGDYFGTQGAVVRDNFFTTLAAAPTSPNTTCSSTEGSFCFNVELNNSAGTIIEGNSEQGSAGINPANCFVNVAAATENTTFYNPIGVLEHFPEGNKLCINGTGVQTFVGSGSYVMSNTNYLTRLVDGQFQIGNGTSDTVASQQVYANSSCHAESAVNAAQATAQSLIAQIYVQPGSGAFTIFHPSGHAGLLYDIYCTGLQN